MPDRKLRVGVLGLGFMGSTHLRALRGISGAEVVAVQSLDERQLAGDFTGVQGNIGGPGERMDLTGVARHRDVEPVLADPSVDAVDICLPTDMHARVAVEALRAGKHVLVEKPMALDGPSADCMVAEAERQERILMTAHVLRFFPEYVALRESVRSGSWGGLRFAEFRRRCAAPGWGGWLGNPAKSGGGVFDLLIHDVDICLALFGKPERVRATGYSEPAAGIDWINAQLCYPGGAVVGVSGGWHHLGAFPFSMEFTVTLEKAVLDFSSAGRALTLFQAGGGTLAPQCSGRDGYCAEVEYFVECCRTGRAPAVCPPRESADSVKLMLMLLEARDRKGEEIVCRI